MRVTNTGQKPITVSVGQIVVSEKDGQAFGELTVDKKFFHNQSILIPPQNSQIVRYYLTGYEGWRFASTNDVCSLAFSYTSDNKHEIISNQPVDCGEIQDLSLVWGAWANSKHKASDYKYP